MAQERVGELLHKQKLVEGMVHSQSMPRQPLVETIVQRQHWAELQALLGRLSEREIGATLEALAIDDALRLWSHIPANRATRILWEVPDDLRQTLESIMETPPNDSQINAFELVDGRLRQLPIRRRQELEGLRPLWIDLLGASATEREFVGKQYGVELPDPSSAAELEVSSRFYVSDEGAIHLRSNFLLDRAGNSRSVPVAFVVHKGVLFSIRNEELPVFRLQRQRARIQQGYVGDYQDLLLDLYGADVEYSADSLEDIYATLGQVGRHVLSEEISDTEAAGILADIAEEEDLNGRIRSNILDTQRALNFLVQSRVFSPNQFTEAKQIFRNIESLNSHTAFLFDKINFLMDATIGFININQNKRVNQLTVFGVVFMPINILAGIGGMSEFSMMTEGIPWPIAYGGFMVGAGVIGWATYLALKHFERRKLKKKVGAKLAAAGLASWSAS